MTIEEIKKKIADQERDIEAKTSRLDATAAEIVTAAKSFFQEWYAAQARDTVKSSPAKAQALGKDKLAEMKAQVTEIVAAAPQRVEEALSNEEVWSHRRRAQPTEKQLEDYSYGRENAGGTLDTALRRLTCPIGNILHSYGLADTSRDSGYWKICRYEPGGQQQCEYGINFTHSSSLEALVGKYKIAVTEWWKAKHALMKQVKLRDEAEALDLYDSL